MGVLREIQAAGAYRERAIGHDVLVANEGQPQIQGVLVSGPDIGLVDRPDVFDLHEHLPSDGGADIDMKSETMKTVEVRRIALTSQCRRPLALQPFSKGRAE